jgi:phospholipase/lecithinase/hemolysin
MAGWGTQQYVKRTAPNIADTSQQNTLSQISGAMQRTGATINSAGGLNYGVTNQNGNYTQDASGNISPNAPDVPKDVTAPNTTGTVTATPVVTAPVPPVDLTTPPQHKPVPTNLQQTVPTTTTPVPPPVQSVAVSRSPGGDTNAPAVQPPPSFA